MLKYELKSRQVPRGKSFDSLVDLGNEMKEKSQFALSIDMKRLLKKDLSFLEHFQHLKSLTLHGGTQNQLKKISVLSQLNDIGLIGCRVENYDFLKDIHLLETLDIRLGGSRDYASLEGCTQLKALNLMKHINLTDISFIDDLTELQFVRLDSCSKVEVIPSLKRLTKLKRFELDTMMRLKEICGISDAPNIKELIVISANSKLDTDSFKCFIDHPTLKKILPGIYPLNSEKGDELNELLSHQLMKGSEFIGGEFEYFEIT